MRIHIKETGAVPPADPQYYIAARNGTFLYKENPVLKTIMPVRDIPFLEEQQEVFEVKYPRISNQDTLNMVAFFFRAYKKYGGEAILLMYYSKTKGYFFHAPEQKVGKEQLEYSPHDRFEGYLLVGSIHSHGAGMAHHSSGHVFSDHDDEVNFDGMHITFGNINSRVLSISCSVMVNGRRFMLDPSLYLSGLKEVDISAPSTPLQEAVIGDFYSTDPYWAPQSGMKNWPELLPKAPDDSPLAETKEKPSMRWQAFWYRLKTGESLKDVRDQGVAESTLPGKDQSSAVKKRHLRQLRNPFNAKIPLFFSLELPPGASLKRVPRQTEWFKNVSSLPITSRLKMLFSFQGGEEGNGYQRAGYQGDRNWSGWNQSGPLPRTVHELPARGCDHDPGRR